MDGQRRKTKKNTKIILAIFLCIIMGGSTMAVYFSTNGIQQQVQTNPTTQTVNPSNTTQFVDNVFGGRTLDCYLVYTNPMIKGDDAMSVQIYNDTKDLLVKQFGTKVYDFLDLPATKLYFFNHCGFFDNRIHVIPNKYNATLAEWNSTNKQIQFEKMRQQVQVQNDFKTVAMKENRIENLASFYFLTYDEVVSKLINLGLLSQDNNCHQQPNAHKGVLFCQWGLSKFAYFNGTGAILVLPDNFTETNTKPVN